MEFLNKGILLTLIGTLIESFLSESFDIFKLKPLANNPKEIQSMANSFLNEDTLNLILGKRLLQESTKQQASK